MDRNKTNTQRTGPRPTPRPSEQRHLEAADKRQTRERSDRNIRNAAYTLLAAGLLSLGVGTVAKGLEAGKNYSQDRTERMANASPKAGEICVIEAVGRTSADISTLRLADRFEDGTEAIQDFSERATAVLPEGDGIGVCRPEDSTKLNDNHVVAPKNIDPEQLRTIEQYAEAGGVSEDIG